MVSGKGESCFENAQLQFYVALVSQAASDIVFHQVHCTLTTERTDQRKMRENHQQQEGTKNKEQKQNKMNKKKSYRCKSTNEKKEMKMK